MEDKEVYYTLKDGTKITDEFVDETLKEFDDAMKNGSAKLGVVNHMKPIDIHISAKILPKELQEAVLYA